MPTVDFPLLGVNQDYGSKKARAAAVNMRLTTDNQGNFKKISRTGGLDAYWEGSAGGVRAAKKVDEVIFYVVGALLYQIDENKNVTLIETIGGTGQATIVVEPSPNREVLVLNGSGDGWIVTSGVAVKITDSNFTIRKPKKATFLNGRFWLVDSVQTNVAFGSALNNFTSYPAGAVFSAEEHDDILVNIVAKKSTLYLIGTSTIELWQPVNDATLPLRKAVGATIHQGCIAPDSVAETDDGFAMLSDDYTVHLVSGGQSVPVSDYSLEVAIKGLGDTRNPAMTAPEEAIGFWIDEGYYKTYVLTFKQDKYTWCFDAKNGATHLRESQEGTVFKGYWRAAYAVKIWGKIIIGDIDDSVLWDHSLSYKTEGDQPLTALLRSGSISQTRNFTVPLIELDMEVGVSQTGAIGDDDEIQVAFSKDGGNTWVNHRSVPIGRKGDWAARVPIWKVGRVVKNKELVMELRTSAPVDVTYYAAPAQVNVSVF